MKHEGGAKGYQCKTAGLRPVQPLVEVATVKPANTMRVITSCIVAADPIGGHRETVFHEGDSPAHQHDDHKRHCSSSVGVT